MKTKLVLIVTGIVGAFALVSGGYCFWLMTVPLSYDLVPVVLIGFVVSLLMFVIASITSLIVLVRMRLLTRSGRPN